MPQHYTVMAIEEGFITEEKAKVVAASWGTELLQFFAPLAILHQNDLKIRLIGSRTSLRIGCKSTYYSTCLLQNS